MALPQPFFIDFKRIRKSILKKSGVDISIPVHPEASPPIVVITQSNSWQTAFTLKQGIMGAV